MVNKIKVDPFHSRLSDIKVNIGFPCRAHYSFHHDSLVVNGLLLDQLNLINFQTVETRFK